MNQLPQTTESPLAVYQGVNLSLSNFINLNKVQLAEPVAYLKTLVEDGYYDPLDALIYTKKLKDMATDMDKVIRPLAEGNVRLAKGEKHIKFNVEVSQKESGVSYDFSNCKDPEWEAMQSALATLAEGIKARETYLKTITKPTNVLVNECEVVEIYPPIRKAKLGLNLSIK